MCKGDRFTWAECEVRWQDTVPKVGCGISVSRLIICVQERCKRFLYNREQGSHGEYTSSPGGKLYN